MRGGKRTGAGAPKGNQNALKHRELICQNCGHHWKSRTKFPVECPACRHIYWKRATIGESELTFD